MPTTRFAILLCTSLFFACSDDNENKCSSLQKADLTTGVLLIKQHDDHHFTVEGEISNIAKGDCVSASTPTSVNFKVFYSVDGNFETNGELIEELEIPVPVIKSSEKTSVMEMFNLYEPGFYSAEWKLDASNLVDEENEADNSVTKKFTKQ